MSEMTTKPVMVEYTIPGGAPGGPGARVACGLLHETANTHDLLTICQVEDLTIGATYGALAINWDWITGAHYCELEAEIVRPEEDETA